MEMKIALTLLILFIAAILDLRTGRISNELILIGYVIGFTFQLLEMGLIGSIAFLLQAVIPIAVLFILFVTRTLGAGDIKLFSVIGGLWSVQITALCIGTSFVVGAAFSLCKLLYHHNLISRLIFFHSYIKEVIHERTLKRYRYDSTNDHCFIHFSIPILIGYLIVLEVVY